MNKILFTGLYPLYHYHLVSEISLLEQHLSHGDDVYFLECNASLNACECNPNHDLSHCARCIGIRQSAMEKTGNRAKAVKFDNQKSSFKNAKRLFKNVKSLDDLKAFKIQNFDLGMAVYSSLVDHSKNTSPCFTEFKERIFLLFSDALFSYENTIKWIHENNPSIVYIFNGRYAVARAIVRACELLKINYFTHERTSQLNYVQLFENRLPHDPRPYALQINKFWSQNCGDSSIIDQGIDFYEERPNNKLTGWHSMISGQSRGLLPSKFNLNLNNIAIFASTEGEFVALLDLYSGSLYNSQKIAYYELLKEAEENSPESFFYLRIHPNSKNEQNKWWHAPEFSTLNNLEIIEPESPVCSYELLANCQKTIGIGSSMLIEGTYWGKPALLLGLTFYSGIDAVYECSSVKEACQLISTMNLEPKSKQNAIKFGAYMRCSGIEIPLSKPINYYTLEFKGSVLEARREVHEWLGACEKRPEVSGIKKWLRDRSDRRDFHKLWKKCDGWFGQTENESL